MVLRCPACSGLEIVMIESEGRLHLSVGGVASISLRKAKRTSASA
jgi:hypothetical protein